MPRRCPSTMTYLARAAGSAFDGSPIGHVAAAENENAPPVARAGSREFAACEASGGRSNRATRRGGGGRARWGRRVWVGGMGENAREKCWRTPRYGHEAVAPRCFAAAKRRAGPTAQKWQLIRPSRVSGDVENLGSGVTPTSAPEELVRS